MIGKVPQAHLADRVRHVVRFNRFYSQRIRDATRAARVIEVNAAELGVFLELLQAPAPPGWLSWRLDLDPSYLSRTLKELELMGFLDRCGSGGDRRQHRVSLTDRGRAVARSLEQFQEDAARNALVELPVRQQRRLVRAMAVIVEIFGRDALTNLLESDRGR